MSDSSGYGGFSAPGPQEPQNGAPSPFGEGDASGAGGYDPYGAGGGYGAADPYGSDSDYGSGSAYGSDGAFPAAGGHGSPTPYGSGFSPSYPPSYQPSSSYPPSYQPSTAYPAGVPGTGYAPRPTSGMAIAGFVLGLVGLVAACGLPSPLGVIFSVIGIQATGPRGTHGGRGFAIAGLVISIVGTLILLVAVGAMVLGVMADSSSSGY